MLEQGKEHGKHELASGIRLLMMVTNEGLECILQAENQLGMFLTWAMRDVS